MADGDRIYTLEEARAVLPQVRAILLQLAVERSRTEQAHEALHHRLRGDGDAEAESDDALHARVEQLRAGMQALLTHLESMGILLRDVETGLVDFPAIRDGERVWLCWRLADPDVSFWHTTREGFASRRPW